MERYALTFNCKRGSEAVAAELLSSYARPTPEVDETTRLLRTAVFMQDNVIVRMFEVEGDVGKAARHLASQPGIQEVEAKLNPHLEEPRDMSPEGARGFFMKAMMERLIHRVVPGERPDTSQVFALYYPFKPGAAANAAELFQMGGDPPPGAGRTSLLSTSVFRKGDMVVRVFEIDGTLDEAVEHLVRASELFDTGTRLQPLLVSDVDLTNEDGLRRFFAEQMMTVLADRVAGR